LNAAVTLVIDKGDCRLEVDVVSLFDRGLVCIDELDQLSEEFMIVIDSLGFNLG
jgi:DNA replicative helicase MCM subunit Mcm2 (Cdc46/Mcm family)